ncbi:CorA family divalent cation transporter [Sulfurospirillum arcachonense]|uniref:CorA family divalent cation transporter n=1 Tax=Sulfurospirillum arcachonense TaxID=57666 RepID=UPI00046A3FDD|nr:CorA family divalent cation transporter [Sulfurospirillum arcachonense]
MFDINDFHVVDIENSLHPSMFKSNENYDLFIVRLPSLENTNLISQSYSYVFKEDICYFYDKKTKKFIDLSNMQGLYEDLNDKINITMEITSNIYQAIENMEDDFYDSKDIKDFNQQWFSKKNDLLRINRLLNKVILEYKKFILNYKKEQSELEIHFEDLFEHLERTNRTTIHALEKLDALYNFYVSTNNEKMNKTVFILTVLSGIFLPLNLLVGFFGMNTTSLPFTKAEGGTYAVIFILIFTSMLSYVLYKTLKKNIR